MAADAVPIADLPLAMAHADAAWQRHALHRLQAHARSEPAVLPLWRQRMREDRPEAPSFAASLLCSLDGANPEHAAAIDEATSVWLDRPVCEVQVLESVFGRADQTDVEERLELWTRIALASPPRFAASRMGRRVGDCQAARTLASGRSAFNDEGVAGTVVVVVCRPMAGRSTGHAFGTSLAENFAAPGLRNSHARLASALRTLGFKGSTLDSPKTLIPSWRSIS